MKTLVKIQTDREIDGIIVHCSASDEKHQATVAAIRKLHTSSFSVHFKWGKYHTTGKEFSDIGYHFIITPNGMVHIGRPLERSGAHCKGYNLRTIGICLVGNLKFTDEQFVALQELCTNICATYDLTFTDVYPHNFFNDKKSCPNFDLDVLKSLWVH